MPDFKELVLNRAMSIFKAIIEFNDNFSLEKQNQFDLKIIALKKDKIWEIVHIRVDLTSNKKLFES